MFRLAFDGRATPRLPYNVDSSDLKAALEGLSTIGVVDVARSSNGYGFLWQVTFVTELGAQPFMVISQEELTGPSASASVSRKMTGVLDALFETATLVDATGSTFLHNVTGLAAGTDYIVKVRARNTEGYGAAGESVMPLRPRAPPSAPEDVELLVLGPTLLKVVWAMPSENGAPIDKYLIEWDYDENFANIGTSGYSHVFTVDTNTPASPYFYNVPLVALSQTYSARVTAHNLMGYGEAQQAPERAVPQYLAPGAPTVVATTVLSQYQLHVDWTAPSDQLTVFGGDGGGAIDHYLVEWDTDFGSEPQPVWMNVDAGSLTDGLVFIIGNRNILTGFVDTTLEDGVAYNVRVTAHTSQGGYGTATLSTLPATMGVQTPLKVLGTACASDGSGSALDISWSLPTNDGGVTLSEFEVEWTSAGADDFTGASSMTLYPIPELQVVTVDTAVTNEVQYVQATVDVRNEVQTLISYVTGVDEIQTITTSADAATKEIQKIRTKTLDTNEVQVIEITATNLDEIQTVTTTYTHSDEVQTVKIYAPDMDEVQTVTVDNTAGNDGTFELHFNTSAVEDCLLCTAAKSYELTETIQWDATAAEVQSELEDLANIGAGNVQVTKTGDGTVDDVVTYTVTFDGADLNGDMPELEVTFTDLDVAMATTVVGNQITGGSFTISVDNEGDYPNAWPGYDTITGAISSVGTTAPIVWNAAPMEGSVVDDPLTNSLAQQSVQYRLDSEIFGSVLVTRSDAIAAEAGGFEWTVTFLTIEGNVADLTCDSALLSMSNPDSAAASCVVCETSSDCTDGNFAHGTFTLDYEGSAPTSALEWDSSEADMKTEIEGLAGMGSVNVVRTRVEETPSWSGGYEWKITFTSSPGDVAMLGDDGTNIAGSSGTVVVAQDTQGNEVTGSFALTFGGSAPTASIRLDCVTVEMNAGDSEADAVDACDDDFASKLSVILGGTVTVEEDRAFGDAAKGRKWTVEFTDAAQGGDVSMLEIDVATTALADDLTSNSVAIAEQTKGKTCAATLSCSTAPLPSRFPSTSRRRRWSQIWRTRWVTLAT